ncbi:DUF305 domain-containing protein [Azospirillum sp. ST 5-10]|uniref:DUF305 domain-containing protein n=1 Tax=unclassified Azospirillum TaxID=2630922 RepID=UPI003F4A104F
MPLLRPPLLHAAGCAAVIALGATAALPLAAHDAADHPPSHRAEPARGGPEAAFLAANDAAMATMMEAMAVAPTGDVDRDFVAMMVPHHQGAVDMALTFLRFGQDERLKRLAQEIIVTQRQEIAAMRLAVAEGPADAAGARHHRDGE